MDIKAILAMMRVVMDLKKVKRAGWNRKAQKGGTSKTRKVKDLESVADHTYSTVMLAMWLLPQLGYVMAENQLKIIKMLLIHDLPESLLGKDQIVYDKDDRINLTLSQQKKLMERKALRQFLIAVKAPAEYWDLYVEFDDNKSRMAQLAHQLDKLDAVLQAHHYAKMREQSRPEEFLAAAKLVITDPVLVELLDKIPGFYSEL